MKYIGRLICCLIIFCINLIKFDVEARLPKYMAQRAAEFKYSSTGNPVGVTPIELSVPGTFIASGREGVRSSGAQIFARKMQMTSSAGDVFDLEMPLDPTYSFYDSGGTVRIKALSHQHSSVLKV